MKATNAMKRANPAGALLIWAFLPLGLGASARGAFAADPTGRPSEDSIFGGSSSPEPKATPPATVGTSKTEAQPGRPTGRQDDAHELGSANVGRDAFTSGEVTDNALTLGGLFYQRMIVSARRGGKVDNTALSMPLQFDGFMDARPSDRVRGFVDGRLLYDATSSQSSLQFFSTSAAPTSFGGTSSNTPVAPSASTAQVALDQAWLKFDIERTVFVTAGKQHVKWGAARFWNPTDLLSSQKRDPLLPYDLRLGNSMVRFELPIESKKTSFYGIALFDNAGPASTLGQLGGAFRAETVIGPSEIGVDVIARNGKSPVYGADVSTPLGPFDVYAEGACVTSAATPEYTLTQLPSSGADLSTLFSSTPRQGPFAQISVGANYSFGWRDNRSATVGVEYFYNQLGVTDANIYPLLILQGQYQPFYTGRNYAAFYLTAEGPDAEKHTSYTFSTLGNLSDMTFVSRLDFSWRILTYLTFESYVDGHFGSPGGEFNFALSTPALTYQGSTYAAMNVEPTLFDVGMALRLSF